MAEDQDNKTMGDPSPDREPIYAQTEGDPPTGGGDSGVGDPPTGGGGMTSSIVGDPPTGGGGEAGAAYLPADDGITSGAESDLLTNDGDTSAGDPPTGGGGH